MMKKEISEELEGLGSSLVNVGNDNPFGVPQNYFDNLDLGIVNVQREVPEDYFSKLSDNVLAEVQAKEKTKIIGINIRKWAAAASIIGICMVAYLSIMKQDHIGNNESFASFDVELEEALDYLIEHDEINISEVMELTQFDVFDEEEDHEFEEVEFDSILDEIGLDDLNELL